MSEVGGLRDRYLDVIRDSVLDLPHLEDEVRIGYLLGLPPGADPDPEVLRDPFRSLATRYQRLLQERRAGRSTLGLGVGKLGTVPYADCGIPALDQVRAIVRTVAEEGLSGDLAICGVGRGGTAVFLRACLEAFGLGGRTMWLVDRFAAGSTSAESGLASGDVQADLHQVREAMDRFGLLDASTRFVQGELDASTVEAPAGPLSLLYLGPNLGADLVPVLSRLLGRMEPGGFVVVEGAGALVERRLRDVQERLGMEAQVDRVDSHVVRWQVGRSTRRTPSIEATSNIHRIPIIAPRGSGHVDLTVIVIVYNMKREAVRTLTSLTRAYQRGIDDLDYEVIVIDNGSAADQKLTAEGVASYGPEFRLVDMGPDAPGSPTPAMNHGLSLSRGDVVAFMVDGAHVLTPGVIRTALKGMEAHEPAVVAVQQWYVGPGQQSDAGVIGYDQAQEDLLFQGIRWPMDGYRLFDIGHFIGDRDWFDAVIESNCIFAPRSLYEQVGGVDDSFDMPSGGYVNLELWERLHAHPGVTPVTLLGEGTFHQFHGGITTNVQSEAERRSRIHAFRVHYEAMRGRALTGVTEPMQYIGAMGTKAAQRTRSRQPTLEEFLGHRDPVGGTEEDPVWMPEALKTIATEALWNQQTWRETTWLGLPVRRYPTDLQSAQEIITDVVPGAVVLVADDDGLAGRGMFVASVLDGLGGGKVVLVGPPGFEPPSHPRIEATEVGVDHPDFGASLGAHVDGTGVLAFVALGRAARVDRAFDAVAGFVEPGSYVVVENTILNGRPVVPDFGPGPHEAVAGILQRYEDFVPDARRERYGVTFNQGGYLARVRPPSSSGG